MKIVSAKELRIKTSAILEETRKGNEVIITLRGKPAALLKPIEKEDRSFKHIGFGLWKDRKDMKDPGKWVDNKRDERKSPSDTL